MITQNAQTAYTSLARVKLCGIMARKRHARFVSPTDNTLITLLVYADMAMTGTIRDTDTSEIVISVTFFSVVNRFYVRTTVPTRPLPAKTARIVVWAANAFAASFSSQWIPLSTEGIVRLKSSSGCLGCQQTLLLRMCP